MLEMVVLSEILVQVAHAERKRPPCELNIMRKERTSVIEHVLPHGQSYFLAFVLVIGPLPGTQLPQLH